MQTRSTSKVSALTRVLHRSLAKSYRAAGGTRGELLCEMTRTLAGSDAENLIVAMPDATMFVEYAALRTRRAQGGMRAEDVEAFLNSKIDAALAAERMQPQPNFIPLAEILRRPTDHFHRNGFGYRSIGPALPDPDMNVGGSLYDIVPCPWHLLTLGNCEFVIQLTLQCGYPSALPYVWGYHVEIRAYETTLDPAVTEVAHRVHVEHLDVKRWNRAWEEAQDALTTTFNTDDDEDFVHVPVCVANDLLFVRENHTIDRLERVVQTGVEGQPLDGTRYDPKDDALRAWNKIPGESDTPRFAIPVCPDRWMADAPGNRFYALCLVLLGNVSLDALFQELQGSLVDGVHVTLEYTPLHTPQGHNGPGALTITTDVDTDTLNDALRLEQSSDEEDDASDEEDDASDEERMMEERIDAQRKRPKQYDVAKVKALYASLLRAKLSPCKNTEDEATLDDLDPSPESIRAMRVIQLSNGRCIAVKASTFTGLERHKRLYRPMQDVLSDDDQRLMWLAYVVSTGGTAPEGAPPDGIDTDKLRL